MTEERRRRLYLSPLPGVADKLRRAVWSVVQGTAFRWSPVVLHGWRRMLLRLFGGQISARSHPYPTARIWAPWNLRMDAGSCLGSGVTCYSVGKITLGQDAIVSQGVHLCAATHDHRDPSFPLMIGDISVGAGAWVSADAFVGPGVVIGEHAVVGACGVVMRDVEAGVVVAGNPARVVGVRSARVSAGEQPAAYYGRR